MYTCCAAEGDKNEAYQEDQLVSRPIVDAEAPLGQDQAKIENEANEKPGHNRAPGQAGFVFKVVLSRKEDEHVGFKADFSDENSAYIVRFPFGIDSAIARYNAKAAEAKTIRVGDYVLEINGVAASTVDTSAGQTVSAALRDELNKATSWEGWVSRPRVFDVSFVRAGRSLGLDLKFVKYGKFLLINTIKDGAVKASCPEVQEKDRIVAVNGVRGDAEELLAAIDASVGATAANESEVLMSLKLSRPEALPSSLERKQGLSGMREM